jgi:hypothetical protein
MSDGCPSPYRPDSGARLYVGHFFDEFALLASMVIEKSQGHIEAHVGSVVQIIGMPERQVRMTGISCSRESDKRVAYQPSKLPCSVLSPVIPSAAAMLSSARGMSRV